MSDDYDITHGGAIAVDTGALRRVVGAMQRLAPRLSEAGDAIRRAHRAITSATGVSQYVDTVALWASADRADALHGDCVDAITGTALMADAYELVELRAELAALELSDPAAADALQTRVNRLVGSDARLAPMADMLVAGWEEGRFEGLHNQLGIGKLISPIGLDPITYGTALLGSAGGFGIIPAGTVLRGTADPVSVRPVATSNPVGPPGSLSDAFERFPERPGAQLKVERYAMPDGSQRFVLYAKGTQSAGFGGSDPWDMKSNKELYTGERSASYQATLDALAASGAKPGDAVDVYAHSQAGMIAAHLSMESEFDVRVQVTAGSPVEPTLADDQLLVQLRHTDDLVSALAGGGSPVGTGSPESIVVQRVADPTDGLQDVWIESHHMSSYIETAEMVDASGDVRLGGIRRSLEELATAVGVEATEYRADRIE